MILLKNEKREKTVLCRKVNKSIGQIESLKTINEFSNQMIQY